MVKNFLIMLTDAMKTASKKANQKTAEATGDLIGNEIANKITNVSKKGPRSFTRWNCIQKMMMSIMK